MMVSTPPHELELVIEFVNTIEFETGVDQLATPASATAWLAGKQLLEPGDREIEEGERRHAIRLREALRSLMLGHNGLASEQPAARELERAARRGRLAVHFADDGSTRLQPDAGGFDGALAMILIPVAESGQDRSWQRVKACRDGDCQWAFYDHSRNRSGVWCEMAVCGNRTKVRAYRARKPG
jgi:predicted RNA-binding Zn ribbon-like protein